MASMMYLLCRVVVRGTSASWRVCGGGDDGFNYNSGGDFLDYEGLCHSERSISEILCFP